MKSLVTLSLAFLLAVGYAIAACPPRYQDLGSGCYYFSDYYNVTWEESFFYCLHDYPNYSSHLVEILDETEQNYLASYINTVIDPQLRHDFWIGASDLEIDGYYRWMTVGNQMYYTAWSAGQPCSCVDHDCVIATYWDERRWHSLHCDHREFTKFICKTWYI